MPTLKNNKITTTIEHYYTDCCDEPFDSSLIGLENANETPLSVLLEYLHEIGSGFLNDSSTADLELKFNGMNRSFWVHKEYLATQSTYFRQVYQHVKPNEVVMIQSLPDPSSFELILEYLYTGDGDKLYDLINLDNYNNIWRNMEYLGLSAEARTICIAFYQANVEVSI